MQYLSIWDLVLAPIYMVAIIVGFRWWSHKKYGPRDPMRKYFMWGLYAKFFGVFFLAFLYEFYYHGGDTYNYYDHAKIINSSLNESLSTWLKLVFHKDPYSTFGLYPYTTNLFFYNDQASYFVCSVSAILGLVNGTTYLPIGLLFAAISYTGTWAMFSTFAKIYPSIKKQLAIAFLFIPSTVFWGSGVMKDTICMFSLGWMTWAVFKMAYEKQFKLKYIVILLVNIIICGIVKKYILLAFLPALGLWLLLTYSSRIQSANLRVLTNIVSLVAIGGGFLFFTNRFAVELSDYSLDNIADTAMRTKNWISFVSKNQEGSAYDLGKLDGTLLGMLKKFPQGVNVTLYRPYLWESRKPIVLFSALESTLFFIFTILLLFKRGVKNVFKRILNDPNLFFFLIYTLIFAFAVGISTGNFGTLSRYKIPCIPFFAAMLAILYFYSVVKPPPVNNSPHEK